MCPEISLYHHLEERALFGRYVTRVSATNRIVRLLMDTMSQKLSICSVKTVAHEEEVGTYFLKTLKSVLIGEFNIHDYETTLDYGTLDLELDGCEAQSDDFYEDPDYE